MWKGGMPAILFGSLNAGVEENFRLALVMYNYPPISFFHRWRPYRTWSEGSLRWSHTPLSQFLKPRPTNGQASYICCVHEVWAQISTKYYKRILSINSVVSHCRCTGLTECTLRFSEKWRKIPRPSRFKNGGQHALTCFNKFEVLSNLPGVLSGFGPSTAHEVGDNSRNIVHYNQTSTSSFETGELAQECAWIALLLKLKLSPKVYISQAWI